MKTVKDYPSYLYYGDNAASQSHSDIPNGEFDLDILISGDSSCWLKNTTASSRNKKKIIFNAVSTAVHEELVRKLMQDGFQVSCCIDDSLYNLTQSFLDEKAFVEMGALGKSSIKKQQDLLLMDGVSNIPAKHFHILDDRNISRLKFDIGISKEDRGCTIDIADLPNSPSKIKHILQQVPRDMKYVAYTYDSCTDQKLKLLSVHHNIDVPLKIETLEIESEEALEQILYNQKIVSEKIRKIIISPLVNEKVRKIIISPLVTIVPQQLLSLLELVPDLEVLYLSTVTLSEGEFDLGDIKFKNLKTIKLNSATIAAKQLSALLRAAPNLQMLDLSYANISDSISVEELDLGDIKFKNLKTIKLTSVRIASRQLSALLQTLPELEDIDLSGINLASLRNIEFKNLKTLNLSTATITPQQLSVLLQTLPELEDIDLSGINLASLRNIEDIEFKNLKTINLTFTTITLEQLSALLQAAPILEMLNLSNTYLLEGGLNLEEGLNLEGTELKRLKKINLHGTTIALEQLSALLQAAPNLQTLDLSRTRLSTGDLGSGGIKYKNLKIIKLDSATIAPEKLLVLLQAAPNLEILSLRGTKLSIGTLNLEGVDLKELKMINLHGATIVPEKLLVLLQAAPNLQTLDLYDAALLAGTLDLKGIELKNLKKINLNNAKIASEQLSNLLRAAPNLEEIVNLSISLTEDLNLEGVELKKLKTVKLSGATIAPGKLSSLLRAVPNLQTLDLLNTILLAGDLNLEGIELKKLEKINLNDATTAPGKLSSLLQAAPNLQTLDLSNTVLSAGTLDLKGIELKNLKKINLNNTKIASEQLSALLVLLQSSPNLEDIGFSSVNLSNLGNIEFKNLKKINLHGATIALQQLSRLLQSSPDLEDIDLSSVMLFGRDLDLNGYTLPNLYKITTTKGVNEKCIQSIINNAALRVNIIEEKNYRKNVTLNMIEGGVAIMGNNLVRSNLRHVKPLESLSSDFGPEIIDFNTEQEIYDKAYEAQCLFTSPPKYKNFVPGIDIVQCRLSCDDIVRTYNDTNDPIDISYFPDGTYNTSSRNIKDVFCTDINQLDKAYNKQDAKCFKCEIPATLPSGSTEKGIALPSLGTEDKLKKLYITDDGGKPMNKYDFEIRYSKHHSQYILFNNTVYERKIKLTFLMEPSKESLESFNETGKFYDKIDEIKDRRIKDILIKYKNFGAGPLTLPKLEEIPSNKTIGEAYMDALSNGGVGSCRHRARGALYELNKMFHERARIGCSNQHAWIEVKPNKKWLKCDLGGHPAIFKEPEPMVQNNTALQAVYYAEIAEKQQATKVQQNFSPFDVWNIDKKEKLQTIQEFTNSAIKPEKRSTLVELTSQDELDRYRQHLLDDLHAKECKKEIKYYYINSPDELSISKLCAKLSDDKSLDIYDKSNGELYKFITDTSDIKKVLVINWSNFKAEDVVKFNTALDENPQIDGTRINENVKILGLHNINDLEAYQGSDFYSRHKKILRFNLAKELQGNIQPKLESFVESDNKLEDEIIVDLHNGEHWKKILIGSPLLLGNKASLQEGALIKASNENKKRVIICNPPFHLEDFRLFVEELQRRKDFKAFGKSFNLDQNIEFVYNTRSYDTLFKQENTSITFNPSLGSNQKVINSSNIWQLFRSCITDKEGKINIGKGILEENAGQTLNIVITNELQEKEWVELYEEAKRCNVKLRISVTQDIKLPFVVAREKYYQPKIEEYKPDDVTIKNNVIISEDIDFTIANIHKNNPQAVMINISELTPSDLIYSLENKFDISNQNKFQFKKSEGVLLKALSEGKRVVLHGKFSNELTNSLASLLMNPPYLDINGENKTFEGSITLVADEKKNFQFCDIAEHNDISYKDKINFLKEKYGEKTCDILEEKLKTKSQEKLSYVYLDTCARSLQYNPTAILDDNWQGLEDLPKENAAYNGDIDLEHAKERVKTFDENRLESIENRLKLAPYVFIAGKTGVGKTSFITNVLSERKDEYQVFFGEAKIKEWIKDHSSKTKILFIDESNLTSSDYSIFEGLFNTPPTIVIDKQIHVLSLDHKVVFAGNPLSYGDRKLSSLLKRHGGSVIYSELSPEYVYHNMILPVFQPIVDKSEEKEIMECSKDILKVYQKIVDMSSDEVLISPRELQMIALSIASHKERKDARNAKEGESSMTKQNLYRSIYRYTEQLIPSKEKDNFNKWFKDEFKIKTTDLDKKIVESEVDKLKDEHFILTQSRYGPYNTLADFLKIRDFRTKQLKAGSAVNNDAQNYGGLGGIVLEGEPGIGKSEFVISMLQARGFTKDGESNNSEPGKVWYQIPVSLSNAEKKQRLIRAFNEGAVVIIDEINSQPMLERLLNTLLSGKDLDGKRPENPGFMLIATQNSISMKGRNATSNALKRRTVTVKLPEYTKTETMTLALAKYPGNKEMATEYVEKYNNAVQHAKSCGLPVPTFRDLIKHLDNKVQSKYMLPLFPEELNDDVKRRHINLQNLSSSYSPAQKFEIESVTGHEKIAKRNSVERKSSIAGIAR